MGYRGDTFFLHFFFFHYPPPPLPSLHHFIPFPILYIGPFLVEFVIVLIRLETELQRQVSIRLDIIDCGNL